MNERLMCTDSGCLLASLPTCHRHKYVYTHIVRLYRRSRQWCRANVYSSQYDIASDWKTEREIERDYESTAVLGTRTKTEYQIGMNK